MILRLLKAFEQLLKKLLAKSLFICGTIQNDRKCFPTSLFKKDKEFK